MLRAGELVLIGNRVVSAGPFLQEALRRYGRPDALAADRWRQGELLDGGAGLNLPDSELSGSRAGGTGRQDVRLFRASVLEGTG